MNIINATAQGRNKSYSIHIEQDLISDPSLIRKTTHATRALIVTTPTISKLYKEFIVGIKENFEESLVIVIAAHEYNKNFYHVNYLCEKALNMGLGRQDVMIAISGGCCNDVVTTAAALYKRGIDVIRIPTTLIGAVDAGIGIKSSLNSHESKSSFGLFHPPKVVLIDNHFIESLPQEHILCGVSEIVKMGLVTDESLFHLLENNANSLASNNFYCDFDDEKVEIVTLAIKRMIEQLQQNFYEDKTFERLVDFGHTFSNTLEPASNWEIPHGFAVSIDMALSSYISFENNLCTKSELERILILLKEIGLPIFDKRLTLNVCQDGLEKAKLHRGGNINLVVPVGIGKGTFIKNDTTELRQFVMAGIDYLKNFDAS